MPPQQKGHFEVELPTGAGNLQLQTQDEVDLWEELADKYVKEYGLSKANDLAILGAILSQHLSLFRAQQRLTGMVPQFDQAGIPTGLYIKDPNWKTSDASAAQGAITKASEEIRNMEKALGIDKKTREQGGAYNVSDYLINLKRAGHMMGVHIARRVKMYEEFNNELSWRVRLLRNGDEEDRSYHGITEKTIIEFCETELAKIEDANKRFAKKQAVFAGRL